MGHDLEHLELFSLLQTRNLISLTLFQCPLHVPVRIDILALPIRAKGFRLQCHASQQEGTLGQGNTMH
jgi:hypothetical protein